MKGVREVVDLLHEVLAGHLVAINQYFLHAKMCENWGFEKLAVRVRAASIDEMRQAERLVARILFLEGLPDFQRLDPLHIGQTLQDQLRNDLELELANVRLLNDGLALCREVGDDATEALLEDLLETAEKHVDWLEIQRRLIERIGEAGYLAEKT